MAKDLFLRVNKTKVLREATDIAEIERSEQLEWELSRHDSVNFYNGILFGNYLVALKRIMKRKENQILNIKVDAIKRLRPGMDMMSLNFNWETIYAELDKIGINIDKQELFLMQ